MESLRRKKDTTFQQLQSSEEKLLSITQAAEFKRSQLSDVHSKLLIEEVAMPQLDKTDLDFECHKSYDGTDSCSSLGDVLHPGQLPETAVDAEALKSSLISIKEERRAIDDHELKKIAGRNQEKAIQNDEAIVSALVKRDPDIRIKDTLDSICCSGKNSNTGSKKLTVHDMCNKSAEVRKLARE